MTRLSTNKHKRRAMKYHLIVALMIATSLCTTSCRDEQVAQPKLKTELVVSQQGTLTIAATAIEHRIPVKTNVEGWTCISKSSWLQARASNNELVLSAPANTDAQPREATVQVVAADQVYSFNVKQYGVAATLDLSNQPDMIGQWGAEVLVDVNTNVDTWTVTSSETWVEATPKYKDDQILIKVIANDTRFDRNATITVAETTSGIKKEFKIVQKGLTYFILPFTNYEGTKEELINFETGRGSKLVQTPTEINPTYKFETPSSLFRTIVYAIDIDDTIKNSQAFFDAKKMASDEDKRDFYNYLLEEGFDHEANNVYYSTKHQSEVELKSNHVLYTYYPLEKGVVQPIDAIPLENIKLKVTTLDEVKKYQSDLNREYVADYSSGQRRLVFRSWDNGKEELHTYYFNSDAKVIEAIHFYENMPRYIYTADNLKAYLSRELRKAINKAGFSFKYSSDYKFKYSYLSPDRNTEMLIEEVKHPYAKKGQPAPMMAKIKFQVNYNL